MPHSHLNWEINSSQCFLNALSLPVFHGAIQWRRWNESFRSGADSYANVQSEALPAPTPALAQPHNPVSQPPSAQPSEVPTEQTPLMMIPPQVPSQIPQTVPRQVRISEYREKSVSIWHDVFIYGNRLVSSLYFSRYLFEISSIVQLILFILQNIHLTTITCSYCNIICTGIRIKSIRASTRSN